MHMRRLEILEYWRELTADRMNTLIRADEFGIIWEKCVFTRAREDSISNLRVKLSRIEQVRACRSYELTLTFRVLFLNS